MHVRRLEEMKEKEEISYEEAYYKATHSFVKNGKDIIIDLFHSSQQFMVIDKRIPELLVKRIDELEKENKKLKKQILEDGKKNRKC